MLKEIRLSNFKIFGGTHTIILSSDVEKPFTVLSSNTTASGKTTVRAAILWCLGEDSLWQDSCHLLNIEVANKLNPSEKASTSVELVFEIEGNLFYFRRELYFIKKYDNISMVDEKYYINGINYNRSKYKNKIDEVLPFGRFLFTISDVRYELKETYILLRKELSKLIQEKEFSRFIPADEIINRFFEKIVIRANEIVSTICLRYEEVKIVRSESSGFDVLIYKDNHSYEYSKMIGVIINVSIILATYNVLTSHTETEGMIPVVFDDMFMCIDPRRFSINDLYKALNSVQTIFLVRQMSIETVSDEVKNKIDKLYLMTPNNNHTNVEVNEVY